MEKEMQSSMSRNYIFSILHYLVALCMPLVTVPYLSRVLGPFEIGRYSFATSIASYFVLLATFGTTLYGQRLIARVRHLPKVRTHFFFELSLLRAITTVIAAVLYCAIVLPRTSDPLLSAVIGVEILAVALDPVWFMQGMEHFAPITLCTTLSRIAAAVCVFLFVKERQDLVLYAAIYAGAILLADLLLHLWVRRRLVRVKRWRPHLQGHVCLSALLFGSSVAIGLYTVLDKTMIGLITGSAAQNGYYEQAQKLVHVVVTLVTAMGVVVASRVAWLWKAKKKEELGELLMRSFRLVFALAFPAAIGLVLIAPRFVPVFYGVRFGAAVPLVAVLSLLIPLIGVSNVTGIQLLAATGREKQLAVSVGAGAVVNVLCNLLLIGRMGALGAAIGSVIAELTVTVIQLIFVRRDVALLQVFTLGMRYLLLADVMGAFGLLFSFLLGDWAGALYAVIGVCALLYLFLLVLLRDPALEVFRSRAQRQE